MRPGMKAVKGAQELLEPAHGSQSETASAAWCGVHSLSFAPDKCLHVDKLMLLKLY